MRVVEAGTTTVVGQTPTIRSTDAKKKATYDMNPSQYRMVEGQDYTWEFFIKRVGGGDDLCSTDIAGGDHYVQVKRNNDLVGDRGISDEIALTNSGASVCSGNDAVIRTTFTFDKELFRFDPDSDAISEVYWKLAIKQGGIENPDETLCQFEMDGDDFLKLDKENFDYQICNQIPSTSTKKSDCEACFNNSNGIWTALGCIPFDNQGVSIVQAFVRIGLSIAGGVLLVLVMISAFMFTTSQGNAQRTGEAKEILTSAVIGMIFIIFSVTILQFIGVTILRIPGFGG